MLCPYCGHSVIDGAKFCGNCGRPIDAGADSSTAAAQPPATQVPPAPGEPQGQAQPQYQPQPQSYQTPTAPVAPPQQPGCLGSAWSDITSSHGWAKSMLLLMVMRCVPILNLYVRGYGLQWAVDAASGRNSQLPKGTFDKRAFLTGLFAAILNALLGIANSWLFVVGLIPLIGWLAVIVVLVFAEAFCTLACVCMALFGSFWQAFQLSDLFAVYKRRVGSLVGATVLPKVIVGAILILVVLVIGGGMISSVSLAAASPYGYGRGGDPMGMMVGLMGGLGLTFVVLCALTLFLDGFAEVWSLRATGIWVRRNAPEWANQAQTAQANDGTTVLS